MCIKTKIIGITGGIGAGKSTVCALFGTLGIPVLYADITAKYLLNTDNGIKEKVIELFGYQAYKDNAYNRSYISEMVFNNPALLKKLNKIVHPAVFEYAKTWASEQTSAYCLYEAALINANYDKTFLDKIIFVSAPEKMRIERARLRDKKTVSQIQNIIAKQQSEEQFRAFCHFEIINDGELALLPQVLAIHKALIGGT